MWTIVMISIALLAVGLGGWLLAPTLRTFRGPAFEPTRKDDVSVLLAEQTGIVNGGQ